MTRDQVNNLTEGDTLFIKPFPYAEYRVPCTFISRTKSGVFLLVERDVSYYWQAAGSRVVRRLELTSALRLTKDGED